MYIHIHILDIPEAGKFMKNSCVHSVPKYNCHLRHCGLVIKAGLNGCPCEP